MNFSLVVAVDKNFGIGIHNTMPWKLPADLKHFANVTTEVQNPAKMNAVIMGRNTWESLPAAHRPLKNRLNIVLSRSGDISLPEGVLLCSSIDEAMQKVSAMPNIENTFVIGGGKVFAEAIQHPSCAKIYITKLAQSFDCDTFFPQIDEAKFRLAQQDGKMTDNGLEFEFLLYERKA